MKNGSGENRDATMMQRTGQKGTEDMISIVDDLASGGGDELMIELWINDDEERRRK